MSATNSYTVRHETVELPTGTVIHFSGLEGGVSFACGKERVKGDYWSQYMDHVTCEQCKAWIAEHGKPQE